MKKSFLIGSIVALALSANASSLNNMKVSFAPMKSVKWDGITIPKGEQCKVDGATNPATPALDISNIPTGATSLIFVYSDKDYVPMSNGGHGLFQYALPKGATNVTVPSIKGNTFDIPKEFKVIAPHRGTAKGKAGVYMPPCSGGRGHNYFLTVQAVKGYSIIGETTVKLGKY